MFDRKNNFVDACLTGEAIPKDIDDYVSRWHDGEGPELLHEFLGMTREEYRLWAERPSAIDAIILVHKEGISLEDALKRRKA